MLVSSNFRLPVIGLDSSLIFHVSILPHAKIFPNSYGNEESPDQPRVDDGQRNKDERRIVEEPR